MHYKYVEYAVQRFSGVPSKLHGPQERSTKALCMCKSRGRPKLCVCVKECVCLGGYGYVGGGCMSGGGFTWWQMLGGLKNLCPGFVGALGLQTLIALLS